MKQYIHTNIYHVMKTKHILYLAAMAACAICFGSCTKSSTSYATELKAEKKLIEQYLERNNITIIYEEPEYDQWKPNEYLELGDYCYFNLTQMGDTNTNEITTTDRFNLRYRKYTLEVNADTISNWNTNENAYPDQYTLSTLYSSSQGLYAAVAKMKYTGAEGKLICPSKLGTDASVVTPYGYDLKIQIRRY